MEKLKGNKHNHLFTDLLKVAIFGLMLLLPFLCFMPTGFYYGFNEHATNETTTQINYKYESNEVNTLDDLIEGNIYQLDNFDLANNMLSSDIYFYVLKYDNTDLFETYSDYEGNNFNIKDCIIYLNTNDYQNNEWIISLYLIDYEGTSLYFEYNNELILHNCIFICNQYIVDYFDYNSNLSLPQYTDYNVIESVETNVQDTISNKMYLAWEGVWTSPLFNWTNTTPLNTGLNGFIGIFGINQSSYIANCLIYLLTITAIYVVFDIVLGIFKWLTHLIGNK